MASIHDLETPAVLIDVAVVERNVARMAALAQAAGVALRPHAKTHKTLEIAGLQRAAGARGLSVAKVGEAEVFAAAGFDNLFVAYPTVGADKARRLLALAERVRVVVGVDSLEGGASLAGTFHAARRSLDVLVKVDTGFHRVGVEPAAAPGLCRSLSKVPGLRLRGLFTHAGHGYHQPTPAEVAAVGRDEGMTLAEVAERVREDGLVVEEVSVGSTPTARFAMGARGVTECRPGNYVFHDGTQLALGSCALGDCAMSVLATVVSTSGEGRAVLDAGSKTLSSDPLRPRAGGYGRILGRESRIERLSEEHGVVAVAPGERFKVGERVRILPNHACVVTNLHDRLVSVAGESVVGEWAVAARGCVR